MTSLVRGEVTAAPVWMRLLSGALDLALEGVLVAGVAAWWLSSNPVELPLRYWNVFDYGIDVVNGHLALVQNLVVALLVVHVFWQTLWTCLIGAAPVARLMGMRLLLARGCRPGGVRVFVRSVLAVPLALLGLIGPLWGLVSPRHRMLHDVLTGCEVLRGPIVESSDDTLGEWADTERRPRKPF